MQLTSYVNLTSRESELSPGGKPMDSADPRWLEADSKADRARPAGVAGSQVSTRLFTAEACSVRLLAEVCHP